LRALLHAAYPLTALGTRIAHLGACRTNLRIEDRTTKHEIGGRFAELRAIDHQAKMFRPYVIAALLEALIHRCLHTGAIAVQTLCDAFLYVLAQWGMFHGAPPFLKESS